MAVIGTLLGGRYRLDARIGRGGMSTVYRAFDTVLERTVAIKLMHREIATDSDQLERFRREARAVAQLQHPNIVRVIDAGEEEASDHGQFDGVGTPYIVLEYVEGETLKELIRREGPLEVPEALAYAIEVARALGAAHDRQIVHRDVKPQNVLIGGEGSAKITDLEEVLAIEAARAGQATGEATSVLRTLPGSARGRLPWRMRHPHRLAAVLALLTAIVATALVIALIHTHRGTGVASNVHAESGLVPVP